MSMGERFFSCPLVDSRASDVVPVMLEEESLRSSASSEGRRAATGIVCLGAGRHGSQPGLLIVSRR